VVAVRFSCRSFSVGAVFRHTGPVTTLETEFIVCFLGEKVVIFATFSPKKHTINYVVRLLMCIVLRITKKFYRSCRSVLRITSAFSLLTPF